MTQSTLSVLIAVAAAAISLIAAWYGRAQAKEARRANDIVECDLEFQRLRVQEEDRARRVRWTVEPLTHGNYVLRNVGSHAAHRVKVSSPSVQFISGPIADHAFSKSGSGMLAVPVVEANAGIKFTATQASAYAGEGYELIVAWDDAVPQRVPMPPPSAG